MRWLFELCDFGLNLYRGLQVCRAQGGIGAIISGLMLAFIAWLIWPWMWQLDLLSTQGFAERMFTAAGGNPALNPIIPGAQTYTEALGWFVTGTTFLPLLCQMFLLRFSVGPARILGSALAVIVFSAFDLITDWPACSSLIDGLSITLRLFGFEWVIVFLLKAGLTILASFGLQTIFFVFAFCALYLVMQGARDVKDTRSSYQGA
jgi:hypothetical protein